jgi:elongator complex protein 3
MARDRKAAGEAFMAELLGILQEGKLDSKAALHSCKVRLARKHGLDRIPSDADVLGIVPAESREELLPLLRTKAVREASGVVTVAAMTSPEKCPHGKCLYCPGGVEKGSPQSYTGSEPAAMRGSNYGFDSYREVKGRLHQLHVCGHPVDKVDLIIMGGTFLARPPEYQASFVKGCYDAMNGAPSETLEQAIDQNETAPSRCIGLTVETRPDWCLEEHIDRMLSYGTTRVEMGVQSLSDDALSKMQRGHGVAAVVRASQLARDAGLKVGYHMMPGFPFVERAEELSHYRRLFEDASFRPDMLKLYPTLVMEGTGLHELWKKGEYAPMTAGEAADFLAEAKSHFPRWVRVQRIQRDIPSQLIGAGVEKSNLRQLVRKRMAEKGLSCRCIRCREVGHLGIRLENGPEPSLLSEQYDASGGREAFIHLETGEGGLAGYVRLRRPSPQAHRPELSGGKSAVVRELRVLGELVPIDREPGGKWQHRGLGARLMAEAERVARDEWKMERLLVNSGAGARGYYRKMGYERVGPYMGKELTGEPVNR